MCKAMSCRPCKVRLSVVRKPPCAVLVYYTHVACRAAGEGVHVHCCFVLCAYSRELGKSAEWRWCADVYTEVRTTSGFL